MKINHAATVDKIRQFRPSTIAVKFGVTPPMVTAVINGTYPNMNSNKALEILDYLRGLGVLVESDDSSLHV